MGVEGVCATLVGYAVIIHLKKSEKDTLSNFFVYAESGVSVKLDAAYLICGFH